MAVFSERKDFLSLITDEIIKKYFCPMPILLSERLFFRAMRKSDYRDMYEYAKQDRVTEYLLWKSHPDEDYTYDYLEYVESRYKVGDFFDWALVLRDSGKMIGTCGFNYFDKTNNSAEIGYVLNPAYWNKGLATEAVKTVIRFGFVELDLNRIEARHIVGNDPSGRVMQKCGMKHEGVLRSSVLVGDEYKTVSVYSILYGEYIRSEIKKGEMSKYE